MKKKPSSLLLVLLTILILPSTVLAESITGIVANVAIVISTAATYIVVIFWIITGILFLTAQGAPEKLSTAKKALYMATVGTALIILAQVASTIIGNALSTGV